MFNKNVKIAFFGTSDFSLIALKEMKRLGIMPEVIVTTKDKPVGRKMILTPTPTKIWGEENGILVLEPAKLKDPEFIKQISDCNLFIVASYGKIIPKEILDLPKYGNINIHPSLLPKYRGPSPLQSQILNNEKEVGVSIMLLDEQVDHGPIIASEKVEITNWPVDFSTLQEITAKKGAEMLSEILPSWISGKLKAKEQDDSIATFTEKIEKEDGLIEPLDTKNFNNYLKILAFEKWPEAFFYIERQGKKQKVIIKKASWENNEIKIQKVLPEGKKKMDYKSFLNGIKTI